MGGRGGSSGGKGGGGGGGGLTVGKDYGGIFGLDKSKGQHMYYEGGDKWRAVNGSKVMTSDSKATTEKAKEYIGRPSVHTGM